MPPPAALAATGNVPLAAGCLGVAARRSEAARRLEVEVLAPAVTDALGDSLLADAVSAGEPDVVGLSLYLWNVERSLHLAREVKLRSPKTKVVVGGPEVSPDNALLGGAEIDAAVTGEGEEVLPELVARLLDGRGASGLAGVAARASGMLSAFVPERPSRFPLERYPSPYLEGLLPVEADRSAYVEAARGCRSRCTYCYYPRTETGLRLLAPDRVEALLRTLADRGAREVSFLDPTFNHRPDFDALLDAVGRANRSRALSLFAELRPERLTAARAAQLAKAGFTRVELGLQTTNVETLKRVGRGGNPAKVAEAAKLLCSEGVDLLLDVIVGLPGDTADDVMRTVDFLEQHGLGRYAQVFPLSVLPGTALRRTAQREGLEYEAAPPYRVLCTATLDEEALQRALAGAEERLGRRLDEIPRPHLVEAAHVDGTPDVFRLDLDDSDVKARAKAAAPGGQHAALWLFARDFYQRRTEAARAVAARLAVDPYATLDVVLSPKGPFPFDVLDALRACLDLAPASYASQSLAHRGERAQRQVCVVLGEEVRVPADWLDALCAEVPVYRDQPAARAVRDAARLGAKLPAARITGGEASPATLARLEARADAGAVTFADRNQERDWQRRVLALGDAGA